LRFGSPLSYSFVESSGVIVCSLKVAEPDEPRAQARPRRVRDDSRVGEKNAVNCDNNRRSVNNDVEDSLADYDK